MHGLIPRMEGLYFWKFLVYYNLAVNFDNNKYSCIFLNKSILSSVVEGIK